MYAFTFLQNYFFLRDLTKIQEGIGEKIGMFIFFMTIFLASLVNAFIHGWELTLVMLSAMPVNTTDRQTDRHRPMQ